MCMFKFGFCRQGRMGERKILRQSAILAFLRALPQRPIFSSNFFVARSLLQTGNLPPPPIRAGRASAPQFSSLFLSSSSSFSAAAAATRKERERERERETKEEGALARRSCSSSCAEISEAIARPTQPQSQIRLRRRRLRGEVAGFFLFVRGFMAPLLPPSSLSSCRKRAASV